MPIRSDFPSFIMAFVIFLSGCCFICHEMEPRSVVNFMDALNKFTSGEVHLIRGKVVHFPPEKSEMAIKSTFSAGKCTKKAGKWFTSPQNYPLVRKPAPRLKRERGRSGKGGRMRHPGAGSACGWPRGVGGYGKKRRPLAHGDEPGVAGTS